jgi:uncharacterized membrane protein
MTTTPQDQAPEGRQFRRYGSFYVAAVLGCAIFILALILVGRLAIQLGAIAFFLTYLVMIVIRLPRLNVEFLRIHADESDIPGYVILMVALGTAAIASGSLFALLNGGGPPDRLHMILGIAAVVLGWLAVHSMLAFHYAYEYYGTDASSPKGADGRRHHVGGLDFPGKEAPDALSFLYFSFVIGMTAQVSDVEVTSNAMRKLVLLHGILAFFFNTVILAAAVNVVVALGH